MSVKPSHKGPTFCFLFFFCGISAAQSTDAAVDLSLSGSWWALEHGGRALTASAGSSSSKWIKGGGAERDLRVAETRLAGINRKGVCVRPFALITGISSRLSTPRNGA